jgi:hypothetical protein
MTDEQIDRIVDVIRDVASSLSWIAFWLFIIAANSCGHK